MRTYEEARQGEWKRVASRRKRERKRRRRANSDVEETPTPIDSADPGVVPRSLPGFCDSASLMLPFLFFLLHPLSLCQSSSSLFHSPKDLSWSFSLLIASFASCFPFAFSPLPSFTTPSIFLLFTLLLFLADIFLSIFLFLSLSFSLSPERESSLPRWLQLRDVLVVQGSSSCACSLNVLCLLSTWSLREERKLGWFVCVPYNLDAYSWTSSNRSYRLRRSR